MNKNCFFLLICFVLSVFSGLTLYGETQPAKDGKPSEVKATGSGPVQEEKPAVTNEKDLLNLKDPVREYGQGADPTAAVKISELLANPKNYQEKEVTVSGMIVDVCPKRGCWMMFASDKKFQTLRIKVDDGVMVFPLSARGHQGTAKGKLHGNELSREKAIAYQKHFAEESGEPFDPASVTGSMTVYMLKATGATIK